MQKPSPAGGAGLGSDICSADEQRLPLNIAPAPSAIAPRSSGSHPLELCNARTCIGFIRPLIHGFEALDLNRRSRGVFPTRGAAADALVARHGSDR
jgi:hypothetical protein